jgi:uncharacterized protein YaeQ
MKYTFTIREGERREKRVLESRGDLPRHIALKLTAYLLWRDETDGLSLQIEQRVGQRHKPDLVVLDPLTGAVRLWIDCGQIETARLGRIASKNPGTRIIVLKGAVREAETYVSLARKDLPTPCRALVEVWGLDDGFTETLAASLCGQMTLEVERMAGRLLLRADGAEPLVTALHRHLLHSPALATGSGTASGERASSPRCP